MGLQKNRRGLFALNKAAKKEEAAKILAEAKVKYPNEAAIVLNDVKIDIENKDIVIGMLQSLSMKEYPDDMFHSFGLTIVDECHHISSEVFSRSLQKIITFYTLVLWIGE